MTESKLVKLTIELPEDAVEVLAEIAADMHAPGVVDLIELIALKAVLDWCAAGERAEAMAAFRLAMMDAEGEA